MRKLSEVEYAKELMTDAMDWSVFKWLWEKGRVRETADKANAALDALEQRVKARWRDDLKAAYKELQVETGVSVKGARHRSGTVQPLAAKPETMVFLANMKRADASASRARMDAEKTFDKAERVLSTSLAREGCEKAIRSWDLKERAIRHAETGIASKVTI
jgi:hypothetical protein